MDSPSIRSCIDHAFRVLLGEKTYSEAGDRVVYWREGEQLPRSAKLVVVASGFFDKYGSRETLPKAPLASFENTPLLFGVNRVEKRADTTFLYADLIASTFFLTTRYEEMVRSDVRDFLGRFPGRESLPFRAGFIDRPVVDEYSRILLRIINDAGIVTHEEPRDFSIRLTHDVDSLRKFSPGLVQPFRSTVSSLLGRRPLYNIPQVWAAAVGGAKDPYDTFDKLFGWDKLPNSVTTRATYFVMAGGDSEYDGLYDLDSALARSVLDRITAAGAQIGLHVSYDAGVHPNKIAAEKQRLERVIGRAVDSSRHHILNWRDPQDGWELAKAGIRHDYTMGYADIAGFRLGTCRPMEMFDPVSCRPFGIVTHPLTIMECTLSEPHYMNLDEEEAFQYASKLIAQTRLYKGECVLLWHNHRLAKEPDNYHSRLYPRLLTQFAQ